MRPYTDRLSGDECFRIEEDGLSLRVTDEFLGEETRPGQMDSR